MVARYTLTALDEVADRFAAPLPADAAPRFNIAPLQRALIRTATGIVPARWGLLPPWRGHGGKRAPHVEWALLERIEETPLIRKAFKTGRCLVIADGFYIWEQLEKKTQIQWKHVPDPARPERSQLVGLAAVATTHRDDDQLSFAFLIGHVPGNPGVIDSRTPLVIPPADYATWLTGTPIAARQLLQPPPVAWRAEPVDNYVNSLGHDDARCVASTRNPRQGELF